MVYIRDRVLIATGKYAGNFGTVVADLGDNGVGVLLDARIVPITVPVETDDLIVL